MPSFSSAAKKKKKKKGSGEQYRHRKKLDKDANLWAPFQPAESQFLPWVLECFVCLLKFERQDAFHSRLTIKMAWQVLITAVTCDLLYGFCWSGRVHF